MAEGKNLEWWLAENGTTTGPFSTEPKMSKPFQRKGHHITYVHLTPIQRWDLKMVAHAKLLCLLLLALTVAGCDGRITDPALEVSQINDETEAAQQEIMHDFKEMQNEIDADLLDMQNEIAAEANEYDRKMAEIGQEISMSGRQHRAQESTRISKESESTTPIKRDEAIVTSEQMKKVAVLNEQEDDQNPSLPFKHVDVREHIRDLNDVDKKVRISACKKIAELGPAGADSIKALIERVNDDEADVRNAAVTALAEIGPIAKSAVPTIVDVIASERLNYTAFDSLYKIGDDEALVKLTMHEQAQMRKWGVRELAKRAHGKVLIEVLSNTILDEDQDVRTLSLDTLNKLTFARDPIPAAPTVPALITLIKRPESTNAWDVHKRSAIWILARFGARAKAAVPTLVKYLDEPFYRDAAMTAIGSMGSDAKSAVPKLIILIEGGKLSFTSLKTAILAAGGIGPDAKSAVPAILDAAGINQEVECIYAFGEIGPGSEPAIPYLLRILNKYRNDERMANTIVHSLAQVGEPSIDPLIDLLASEESSLAGHAETALIEIGPNVVPTILEGLLSQEPDARISRSSVLAGIAEKDFGTIANQLDTFAAMLDDGHYKVRLNALTILKHYETVPVIVRAKVEKAKDDPESKQVRELATTVLDKWADRQ